MTVFRPRFHVPIEYERDPDDEPPEPPRRFAPKFKPKPIYTNTSVQTDYVEVKSVVSEPVVASPVAVSTPKAVAAPAPIPVAIPAPIPVAVPSPPIEVKPLEPPKAASPMSRNPQTVLKDDPELLNMISDDPKTVALRGDVIRYCNKIAKEAQQLATDGFLLKAYVLYEYCHKVTSAAIRVERDEAKLDQLSELDWEYRREMLALDRKIKQFGAVMEKTTDTAAAEVEKPFQPAYTPRPSPIQSQSEHTGTETEEASSKKLACFQCGHMVEPVPTHPFPAWLACCCPAKMKCPDCGEILDAGDHEGDEEDDDEEGEKEDKEEKEEDEEDEQEEEDEEEEDEEDDRDSVDHDSEDNDDNDGTNSSVAPTQTQTGTDYHTATTGSSEKSGSSESSDDDTQTCPECAVEVTPVPVNSRGDCLAALCPCLNKVTLHCPECDYNLTDMVPADSDDEDDDGDEKEDEE